MNLLCFKLRKRHVVWNPATSTSNLSDDAIFFKSSDYSSLDENVDVAMEGFHQWTSKTRRKMSPPLPVTEDTPPDMLAGAMDLHVVLPSGQDTKMSVERSTPMMDLLVQITTANKISPGGHIIQAIGDRGILPYKPSTPIGALDTWTIRIVPKKQAASQYSKKLLTKPTNPVTPFEQTFRLQVNLPRNQLYVSRVSYKTRLEDILREVCEEKSLDQGKYCLVHPEKLNEELDLSQTFLDCKLQRVTLLAKNNRPVGLSSVDIMALKRYDTTNQTVNNKYVTSHSYDGSISSGSLEGRSLSPVRSDESSSSPTIPKTTTLLNRPFRKRRPAPKPPCVRNSEENKRTTDSVTISHSRNSSDSSGYHDSSVLSESPESNSNSLADSLPRRSRLSADNANRKKPAECPSTSSNLRNGKIGTCLSRSLSNLAVVEDSKKSTKSFFANGMRRKEYSVSSMSLASIPGKRKKAPAPPPPVSKSLLSLKEEEVYPSRTSTSDDYQNYMRSQTLPADTKPPKYDEKISSNESLSVAKSESAFASCTVDARNVEYPLPTVDAVDSSNVSSQSAVTRVSDPNEKYTMDDEEIDRIFHDATKSCESPPLSTLPSPPESIINNIMDMKNRNSVDDPYDWQYKLPSPPKAFRDQTNSPTTTITTEYDTATVDLTNSRENRRSRGETEQIEVKTNTKISKIDKTKTIDREVSERSRSCNNCIENDRKENLIKNQTLEQNNERTVYKEEKVINCEKSPYSETNYGSTNDSGLGSDDSIPSVSECKIASREQIFVKKASDKRDSGLNNFTITTYQNSKPTDIFRDESVKTSKTTRLAENNHPFVKTRYEKKEETPSNRVDRRSSFNVERTPGSSIKRSKSHISVLSGNFSKFNKLNSLNHNGNANDSDDSPVESGHGSSSVRFELQEKYRARSLPNTSMSSLRRSTSECSIIKDTDKEEEEMLELRDQVVKWKEDDKLPGLTRPTKNAAELQSLQVLKDILPHINKQQRSTELMQTAVSNTQDDSTSQMKILEKSNSSVTRMPTVNLQSWSERPKRQVSIKTDRDYVFGKMKEQTHFDENQEFININGNEIKTAVDNRVKISVNCKSDSNENASRVPVVRAVAFKKPLVQNYVNGKKSYHNKSVDIATVTMNGNRDDELSSKITRAKPASFYLYGELTDCNCDRVSSKESAYSTVSNKECLKIFQNDCKPQTDSERKDSCGRSTISSNDINRKHLAIGSSHTNSMSNKKENFTFKTYKMKLIENEKGLSNGKRYSDFDYCLRQNSSERNSTWSSKTVVNINGEINGDSADGKVNGKVSTFGQNYQNSFSRNGTKSSVIVVAPFAAPVPPPAPPPMKTASITTLARAYADRKTNWSKARENDNPREVLLSSIKNFNRDNLRKLRVK